MQLFGLNRHRSESLLLIVGQLVLIAYVFQVAAFDHWHVDVGNDVAGIAGSSAHAAVHSDHCHGAASACADAGGGFAHVAPNQVIRLPSELPSLMLATQVRVHNPPEAFIAPRPEPPRSAA